MAHLVVQEDGKTTYVELKQPVTTVGRHPNCTIQILDTKASRQHCQIEECERGYKLVDLQSANGTQVNGEPVRHRILEAGDRIEIGSTVIAFEVERKDVLKARRLKTRRGNSRSRRRRRLPLRPPNAAADDASDTGRIEMDASSDDEHDYDDDDDGDASNAGDVTHTGGALADTLDLKDRAELAIAIRRLINALIEGHDEDGLIEVERIFEEFMSEGTITPRVRHLIEFREMIELVLEINQAINSELHLEALLDKILDETIDFTNAERGFLILLDETRKPRVERTRNFDREPINNPDEKFSHAIVDEVLAQNRPLLSTNAFEEDRFATAESVHAQRLLSVLCVPLKVKDKQIGVLYIDNRFETGVFAERDLLWLEAIADQAAIAIENARQARALEDALAELKAKNSQIEQLNALLAQKLEAREMELASVKAKLAEGANPATVGNRGGFATKYPYPDIIGRSPAMRTVFELLDKATDIDSIPVLIVGENGTGKELAARALHVNGPRAKKPFVAENCAAVPETLFEATFFGYTKGAYTGAQKDMPGLFEQADGGTLFLDEVGDLPLEMQKKLLRVLNDGEVRRVGANAATRKVNVRIIAATNRDLDAMMSDGTFREDLYFRLNVFNIRMPSLRERIEDIPELTDAFFGLAFSKMGLKPKPVDPEVYSLLSKHRWPGNVRQLWNIIQRIAMVAADRSIIDADCVPDDMRGPSASKETVRSGFDIPDGLPLKEAVKVVTERVERDIIAKVWRECNWKKIDAAEKLGVSRPTLDAKIEAYGLKDLKDQI